MSGNTFYGLYVATADSNTVTQSYMSGGRSGAAMDNGSDYNTVSLSTMISNNVSYPGLYIFNASSNTIVDSFVQGSTAAHISASTGTVIRGAKLVATNAVGSVVALTDGSVNLTVTSSTFQSAGGGRGLWLDAGNNGVVAIGSVTVTGSSRGLEISTQAAGFSLAVDSITFRGLTTNATAIHFLGGTFVSTITLANFEDTGVGANVSAAALSLGSRVNMRSHYGVRTFPAFENDPSSIVDWDGVTPIVLAGPSNGVSVSTSLPTFVWAGGVPLTYRFVLAQDAGFASIAVDTITSHTFLASPAALVNSTTSWWKVGAHGTSVLSPAFSFVVDLASPVYTGPQVSTAATGFWTNLPMTTYLSSNVVSARITLQDPLSGLLVSTGLPTGLVGQWHFDESTGTAALDASTNALNGAFSGGSAWGSGYHGGALNLATNGSFVQAPHKANLNSTDITIELWIKPAMGSLVMTGGDPFMALVAKRTSNSATPYVFGIRSGGTLSLNWWGAGFPSPMSAPVVRLNRWQHVAVTRSGSPGTI